MVKPFKKLYRTSMPMEIYGTDNNGRNYAFTGMYDSWAPGDPSIVADRVLDITDLVPGTAARALLMYSQDSGGRIIQFMDCYRPDEASGSTVSFHLSEDLADRLGNKFMTRDWGFDPHQLLGIITEYLPPAPPSGY